MTTSKKIPVLLVLSAFVVMTIAAIKPTHGVMRTKGDFENLKVLPKNISADSLYVVMDRFEDALGVKCAFCHVMKDATGKENYASDAQPTKDSCRSMMRMTMDINKKYFATLAADRALRAKEKISEMVTCSTCHRGKPIPPEY